VTGRIRQLLIPGLTTLLGMALLLSLGTWQVERLHWKRGILAQIAQAEASPPAVLAPEPRPWSKVAVTGRLRNDLTALYGAEVRDTRAGPTMGSELIVPLEREEAPPVLVDRGWVPASRRTPLRQPQGKVTVVGYVRPPDQPGWFSARDDVAGRQFFTLDPAAIGRALGLAAVAPFTVVALGEPPSEGWPIPAQHLPQPPNNHLSYAVTWYSLAAALLVIFLFWSQKALHR
jgi:surfeit locus 1 family protein